MAPTTARRQTCKLLPPCEIQETIDTARASPDLPKMLPSLPPFARHVLTLTVDRVQVKVLAEDMSVARPPEVGPAGRWNVSAML